jgi:hypothetical protein
VPNRLIPVLRVICLLLAGLFTFQVSRLAGRMRAADSTDSLLAAPLESFVAPSPAVNNVTNPASFTNAVRLTASPTNVAPPSAPAHPGSVGPGPASIPSAGPLPGGIPGGIPGAGPGGRSFAGPGPGMPGASGPPLPPAIQARVDRITQSEILGPVVRPLPMALLGIAGQDAILRAPDGRVGLVRVGEELGGVKLLRIGTNRVLIEHEKQRKELTLYSGFGSEPLLSKEKQESK